MCVCVWVCSVIMACFLLTTAIGNALVVAIAESQSFVPCFFLSGSVVVFCVPSFSFSLTLLTVICGFSGAVFESRALEFIFFAGLMVVTTFVFLFLTRKFKYKTIIHDADVSVTS